MNKAHRKRPGPSAPPARPTSAKAASLAAMLSTGSAELRAGRPREALLAFRRALILQPGSVEALSAACRASMMLRDTAASYLLGRRTLRLDPVNYDAALTLAKLALSINRLDVAKRNLDVLAPLRAKSDPEYYRVLGLYLLNARDAPGAIAAFTRRLKAVPRDSRSQMFLGAAHQLNGDLPAAVAAHRRAVEIDPRDPGITSNLIVLRDFDADVTMADLAAERRDWQRRHGAMVAPATGHANPRDPDRPLRIGYVSSYFHLSSGAEILIGIVENHGAGHEVFCYSSGDAEDDMTRRFRARSRWVNARRLSDEALAERIRGDGIDILVDADGHSPHNRLTLFARKPAPVQATGWGHAGGTGLAAMDYAFVDPVFARPDEQVFFSERLVNLPCVLTMKPPADAPAVAPAPAERQGFVTFGCLNRLTKVSPPVLGVWAQILVQVPDSRLLLKGRMLDDPSLRGKITDEMARHGIGAERLLLVGGTSRAEHLAAHGTIDIALDPFPMNGGIATIEALWMGVPVVTFAGPAMFGRLTAAVLTALGEPGLVAHSLDDYVAKAAALAADRPALVRYRATLRERAAASPVANPALYARAVEQAYRTLWRTWCGDAPAG